MKKSYVIVIGVIAVLLAGCSGIEYKNVTESTENTAVISDKLINIQTETSEKVEEPYIRETDWSSYFGGINGTAVFYEPAKSQYKIYNAEIAEDRHSPCSTFKIISGLIGLETGVIAEGDTVRAWSGENYWNQNWNKNVDFEEAFRVSCVWYFREVINEVGKETMQRELEQLKYGNCDISDWEGRLNTANSSPSIRGFWLESTLKISAREQTEVLERIFGRDTLYRQNTISRLKRAMKLSDMESVDSLPVYGKTGMGTVDGAVADVWFSGFTELPEGNVYFCIYLGKTKDMEISTSKAKQIAAQILGEWDQG